MYYITKITLNKRLKRATATVRDTDNKKAIYKVRIEPCYESFIQYGAPTEVLRKTVSTAEKLVRNQFKAI